MAMAFLTVMMVVALVISGFAVYGMYLGIAQLFKQVAWGYRWLLQSR